MKKRILSILLSLVMIIGAMPLGTITVLADEPTLRPDGKYHITSEADWDWFVSEVNSGESFQNQTVVMDINHLTVSSYPGDWDAKYAFSGTFDGNGSSITLALEGASSNKGLFGYTIGAKIRNLKTYGTVSGTWSVAGIVGCANTTEITNCENYANITGSSSSDVAYAGGIVGVSEGGVSVSDCKNFGTISGNRAIGGIVGETRDNDVVKNCLNAPAQSVSGADEIGGIVGNGNGNLKILNCINRGAVGGTNGLGGIIGHTEPDFSKTVLIANCINYGDITSNAGGDYAGGIVGCMACTGTLKNCFTAAVVLIGKTGGIMAGIVYQNFTGQNCYYQILPGNNSLPAFAPDIDSPELPEVPAAVGVNSTADGDMITAMNTYIVNGNDTGDWNGWVVQNQSASLFGTLYLDKILNADHTVAPALKIAENVHVVTEDDTVWGDGGKQPCWYVVTSDVALKNRPVVQGDVRLILTDKKTLTANQGITVEDENAFALYAQTNDESQMGSLSITTTQNYATGIGGRNIHLSETGSTLNTGENGKNCGTVSFYGGNISLSTSGVCVGGSIGAIGKNSQSNQDDTKGGNGGNGGSVSFYGGNVTLTAMHSPCIGGGEGGRGVSGGMNEFYTGHGGQGGDGGSVYFYDGTVTLTALNAPCIGGGKGGDGGGCNAGPGGNGGPGGTSVFVSSYGGTILFHSASDFACIGGGKGGNGGAGADVSRAGSGGDLNADAFKIYGGNMSMTGGGSFLSAGDGGAAGTDTVPIPADRFYGNNGGDIESDAIGFYGGTVTVSGSAACIKAGNGSESGHNLSPTYGGSIKNGAINFSGGNVILESSENACIKAGDSGSPTKPENNGTLEPGFMTISGSPLLKAGSSEQTAAPVTSYAGENYFSVHYMHLWAPQNSVHKCTVCNQTENHQFVNGVCTGCGAKTATYYEYNTETGSYDQKTATEAVTPIISSDDSITLPAGWYLVSDEVTVSKTITFQGDAHIILANGAALNVPNGIIGTKGSDLSFYAQTTEIDDMGRVIIPDAYLGNAGIGSARQGECGDITIQGGIFDVRGGLWGAGIGTGADGICGAISINGGRITSEGGAFAAGIGSGYPADKDSCVCGEVVIQGGIIKATAGDDAEHIGAGYAGTVHVTVSDNVFKKNGDACYYINIEPFPETTPSCIPGHRTYYKNCLTGKYYTDDSLSDDALISDLAAWLAGEGKIGEGNGNHLDKNTDGHCDVCGILTQVTVNYYMALAEDPAFSVVCDAGQNLYDQIVDELVSLPAGVSGELYETGYNHGNFFRIDDLAPFGRETLSLYAIIEHDATAPDCIHAGTKAYFEEVRDSEYYEDEYCTSLIGGAEDLEEWFKDGGVGEPATGVHTDNNGNNLCDICGDVVDKNIPTTTGISLTLASDIYMNFYMHLPQNAVKNGEMIFTIGEREVTGVTAQFNEDAQKYYFACPLNVLEMAETLTATFSYNDVDYIQTYSVKKYVETILTSTDSTGKFVYTEQEQDLARKIANYGYHAQLYLASIHSDVTIGEDGYAPMLANFKDDINVANATEALSDYKIQTSGATENLAHYGTTVYFDSATSLNYYITVKNGVPPTATAKNIVTNETKTVEIELYKNNIYIVSVKDIIATELGDDIEVTINGEMTMQGSVLAYCHAVITAHTFDGATEEDALAVRAMTAFYEYHQAACAYVESTKPHFPCHDTLEEYTWEELKTVSNAISDGTISENEMNRFTAFANEAQTKKVPLNNGDTLYVRIIGFNHDQLSIDTERTAGITFMAVNAINQGFYSGNKGSDSSTYAIGWANSPLREKMQPGGEIYTQLPSDLTAQIESVSKCSYGGWDNEEFYNSLLKTSNDQLFLLSGNELGTDNFGSMEGTKYEYIDRVAAFYPKDTTVDPGVWLSNLNATGYEFVKANGEKYNMLYQLMEAAFDAGGNVNCIVNTDVFLRSVSQTAYNYCGTIRPNGDYDTLHVLLSAGVAPCFCI